MAGFSDYLEAQVLNHCFRNVSYTPPSTVYLALFTVAPADDGTGGTEISAGDYTRKAVTFSAATVGSTSNSGTITFAASAASAWGTIVAAAVYDASTSGNMMTSGPVSPALVIGVGSPVVINVGELAVTLD